MSFRVRLARSEPRRSSQKERYLSDEFTLEALADLELIGRERKHRAEDFAESPDLADRHRRRHPPYGN